MRFGYLCAAALCVISNASTTIAFNDTLLMGDGDVHDGQPLQYLSETQIPMTAFTTADDVRERESEGLGSDRLGRDDATCLPVGMMQDSHSLTKAICDAPDTKSEILITFASNEDAAPCNPEKRIEAEELVKAFFFFAEEDLQLEGTPTFDFTNICQGWMWMFTFTVKNTPGYLGGECEYPTKCAGMVYPGVFGIGALTTLGPPVVHLYNTINDEVFV